MFEATGKSSRMSGPKARICYICGRQYMVHSFEIHVTQCRDLFEKREMTKPPKERRKCPTDPTATFKGTMNLNDLDAVNAASQQAWTGSLAKCKYCGRSFLQEKIHIHNKSCTADNPARRVDEPVRRGNEKPIVSYQQGYDDPDAYESGGGGGYGGFKCNDCGRSFNEIAYEKHIKICKKVFKQKRKVYDSAKHRAAGTELAAFQKSNKKGGASSTMRNSGTGNARAGGGGGGMPKWQADSIAFRQAMREARMVSRAEQQSKATGIPLHQLLPARRGGGGSRGGSDDGYSAPADDPSFIHCPTCGRNFNQKAGERHIPQCQSIINKPKRLAKNSGHPPVPHISNHRSSYEQDNDYSFGGGGGFGSAGGSSHTTSRRKSDMGIADSRAAPSSTFGGGRSSTGGGGGGFGGGNDRPVREVGRNGSSSSSGRPSNHQEEAFSFSGYGSSEKKQTSSSSNTPQHDALMLKQQEMNRRHEEQLRQLQLQHQQELQRMEQSMGRATVSHSSREQPREMPMQSTGRSSRENLTGVSSRSAAASTAVPYGQRTSSGATSSFGGGGGQSRSDVRSGGRGVSDRGGFASTSPAITPRLAIGGAASGASGAAGGVGMMGVGSGQDRVVVRHQTSEWATESSRYGTGGTSSRNRRL